MSKQWRYLHPHPTFWQVRKGYLLYRNEYHAVERMSSPQFRTIVLDACPDFAMSAALHQTRYDIVDRWHILQRYRIKLFYLRNGVFYDR